MTDGLIGSVRFSAKPQLWPWTGDPSENLVAVKAKIEVFRESSDDMQLAGKMRFLVVRASEAVRNGFRIAHVCDAFSSEAIHAFCAVTDDNGEWKPELKIFATSSDFVVIEQLSIRRPYRRSGLGAQAIQTVIATWCPDGVVIAHRELDLSSADRLAVGFKAAEGTEYMVFDPSALRPGEKSAAEQ